MWNLNGILIQGLNDETGYIKNFSYNGINAYFQFPLTRFNDTESTRITQEQQVKMIEDNMYINLDFITSVDLYERYVKKCRKMNIEIRVLFIESEYTKEIWHDKLPTSKFLGYEYCPIPIDEQIITDMDWYVPFSKYWKILNKYGLFDTYHLAKKFANEYEQAFSIGKIGDGEINGYICKVYLVEVKNTDTRGRFSCVDKASDL